MNVDADDFALIPRDTRSRVGVVALAIAIYAYLSLFRNALIDDAFITLRYVRTLAHSGTWGMFPGHVSNTATSPLNVLLLTLTSFATPSPITAVVLLTTIELVAIALFLRGIGRLLSLRLFGPLAFVALVLNPWWISTFGLESMLMTTLLIAGLYFLLAARYDAMALACALLVLTRPDGILFPAVAGWFIPTWRRRLRALAIFSVAITPWYAFSWVYLGSFVPDTLLLKVNDPWGPLTFATGLRIYYNVFPVQTLLAIVLLPGALFAWLSPVRKLGPIVPVAAGYGALHFLAYSLLRSGPFHWYYVPELVSIALLGSLTISALWRAWMPTSPNAARALVRTAFAVPAIGAVLLLVSRWPIREAFVHTNWAKPGQYRVIGDWLKREHGNETGLLQGEVGTLAYYCDCVLLNKFGDRSWLAGFITNREHEGGVTALAVKINFHFFTPPKDFDPPTYDLASAPTFAKVDPEFPFWEMTTVWPSPMWLTWTPRTDTTGW